MKNKDWEKTLFELVDAMYPAVAKALAATSTCCDM